MSTTLQGVFRETMAGVPTPVSVVTTLRAGRPYGTTVSAWASLSMDPPMTLVSLDRTSRLLVQLRATGRFGVNILTVGQTAEAARFATKADDKFAGLSWQVVDGLPRLGGGGGWLACEVTEYVPGGDHVLVLGRVVGADPGQSRPLTYHAREFGTHHPLMP